MPTKKRILFFVPTFPVMSETFIEKELCELKKRGNIEMRVVSLKEESALNCRELKGDVIYIDLQSKDIFFGFFKFARNNPIGLWKTAILSLNNPNGSFLDNVYIWLKSIGYAYRFLDIKFDHIHAHFLSKPSTIAFFAAILVNVSFSVSGHARDVFGQIEVVPDLIAEKLRYAKFAALCNKKAYIHCVNIAGTKDKTKPRLLPHGVDISAVDPQVTRRINEVPQIYFLGRLVEKKGVEYLIRAAKYLKDSGEEFKLLIAGYGVLYETLKKLRDDEDLSDCVNFLNDGKGLENQLALNYMRESDIFVMPSIDLQNGDSDGIPNNILEAGMFSIPVVTTDAGSISEVIKDNETGLIVNQRDPRAIAEAIKRLIHDKDLSNRLGIHLQRFVKENFDVKKNIVELEELLIK